MKKGAIGIVEDMALAPVVCSNARQLSSILNAILRDVQTEIGLEKDKTGKAQLSWQETSSLVEKVSDKLGIALSSLEKDELFSFLEKEGAQFGILQPLVDDSSVSDIIITNHAHISVQQGRRNYRTDIRFPNEENFEQFVEKLLTAASATYSTKKPIADGIIGSFARIHAVHKCLCDTGPYVTIRLNRFSRVSLDMLVTAGLAPKAVLEYLRGLISTGHTILIVGEVGTGKTTLARALAGSIPAREAILVIEDTPEIRLEHPHVRYMSTREANTDGAGRISPSELIRAGMRMAMNRIIFGEIRDAEAAEAFVDVCASGHPGLSTIHARSCLEAVTRLELFLGRMQKGVDRRVLTEQIATAVHAIVTVDICTVTRKRRVMEVREIGPVADGTLRHREMFKYSLQQGLPSWKVGNKTSAYRDKLEEGSDAVHLAKYPSLLELEDDLLFKEALERPLM